ncbi:MAG: metallophosphoesterase [Clostridia bacterium]
MKVIHTGDLHLDSSLSGFDKETSKELKGRMMLAFSEIAKVAEGDGGVVIIAGDMFDRAMPSIRVRDEVMSIIESHKEVEFYIISGNHDNDKMPKEMMMNFPNNVKMFGDKFSSIEIGKGVVLTAAERPTMEDWKGLKLAEGKFNIVMAHAAPLLYGSDDEYAVNVQWLQDKACDYLALGHYHTYNSGKAGRGEWVMCGTPCARGFDETGEKGYVELEIEDGKCLTSFRKIEGHRFYDISVDISKNAKSLVEVVIEAAKKEGAGVNDAVKVTLKGVSGDAHIDTEFAQKQIMKDKIFFYIKIEDETKFATTFSKLSLYSEFEKLVKASLLPQSDKDEILRYGYLALSGQEVDK